MSEEWNEGRKGGTEGGRKGGREENEGDWESADMSGREGGSE